MRDLPVKLPPPQPTERRGRWNEVLWLVIAFAAMFGGAMLGFEVLAG